MDSDNRFVYYYDESKQRKDSSGELVAPISLVFENISGHYPTGDDDGEKLPWYWTQKHCDWRNQNLGYSPKEALEIVLSSMFA